MPPVRCAGIAPESARKGPSCGGADFLTQLLRVLQPCLKVGLRSFNHDRRREPRPLHLGYRLDSQGIHETQIVFALGANIDIPTLTILMAEPSYRTK